MKKLVLVIGIMAICSLCATNGSAEGEPMIEISAASLEAASLSCSDGTKVFGIKKDGVVSSAILVEKDGVSLFYDDEFEDIQHIQSIYCLKNAIVITGTHGAYFGTSVLPFSYEGITSEKIGATRRPVGIDENDEKTVLSVYGDDREGEQNKIIRSFTFYKPFKARIGAQARKVKFSEEIEILYPSKQNVSISTIASCYNRQIEDDYTLMAYTDKTGASYAALKSDDPAENARNYRASLPFTATNSMCLNGSIYLFGLRGNTLQAARFSFDAHGEEILELIDASNAPLQPSILKMGTGKSQ